MARAAIPIPTPPGIGLGPEVLPAPAPPPKKIEMVAGMPVGPERGAEKLPMGAPSEHPTAILGIVEQGQIDKKTPRTILEQVATADIQPEPAIATPVAESSVKTADTTPATLDGAALEKKRQETKHVLQELGRVLLEAGDTRASLTAVGLSAGDTPMADEFRNGIVELLLMGGKPHAIDDTRWMEMQRTSSPTPPEQSSIRKFFERHHFPMDLLDQWGGETAGAHQVLGQKSEASGIVSQFQQGLRGERNQYTPIAQDLQREMGWSAGHPMPSSHEALAQQFGEDPKFTEQMKAILGSEKRTELYALINTIKRTAKDRAPGSIQAILMIASLLEGMVQQGTADAGNHAGASH